MANNKIFENYYINYRDQVSGSLEQLGNDHILSNGSIQSSNFIKGDPTTGQGGQGFGFFSDGSIFANKGIFRGVITASEIHIPYEEAVQSFHVLSNGNSFSGCKYSSFKSNIENAPYYVLSDGTLKATIGKIGGITIFSNGLRTSDGSTRIEMLSSENEMRVYNSGNLVSSWGAFNSAEGEMFMINYNTTGAFSPFFVRGNVPNTALAWFNNDGNNQALTISSNTSNAGGALYVRNGTTSTIGTGIASTFESNSTDPLLPTVYIKNGGSNGTALRLNGKFISDNQEPRADNTYNIGSTSLYYKSAYIRSIKTGFLEPYLAGSNNMGTGSNRWDRVFCRTIDASDNIVLNGVFYSPQQVVASVDFGGSSVTYKTALCAV